MVLQQLRYVIVISETGTLSRVAEVRKKFGILYLSEFNMDTVCVELIFADGRMISIDCTAGISIMWRNPIIIIIVSVRQDWNAQKRTQNGALIHSTSFLRLFGQIVILFPFL